MARRRRQSGKIKPQTLMLLAAAAGAFILMRKTTATPIALPSQGYAGSSYYPATDLSTVYL
jgi:hypothetical protein